MSGHTWEITNPSDYYTIVGDFEAAACAVLLLGEGAFGMRLVGGDGPELPIFLLGGFEEWADRQWPDETFGEVLSRRRDGIAVALASVLIGDRGLFEKSGMDRDAWHDHHRTSINDIGARAYRLADAMLAAREEG